VKIPEQKLKLVEKILVNAIKELNHSNPEVAFSAATFFTKRNHDMFCRMIMLDPDIIYDQVLEVLREKGVRAKRLSNDTAEYIQDHTNNLIKLQDGGEDA
jgi:hypothetical protein